MIETAGRNEYKIKEKAKNDFFFGGILLANQ